MTKNKFKKYLLDDNFEDEDELVLWTECENTKKEYYDCGCCDDCLCNDNIQCSNCGCNCNCNSDDEGDEYVDEEYFEDNSDDESGDDEDSDDDFENNIKKQIKISNFDIHIIESKENEKKVRITLKINVSLNNIKKETINIDLDINKTTYLKIAEELFTTLHN